MSGDANPTHAPVASGASASKIATFHSEATLADIGFALAKEPRHCPGDVGGLAQAASLKSIVCLAPGYCRPGGGNSARYMPLAAQGVPG